MAERIRRAGTENGFLISSAPTAPGVPDVLEDAMDAPSAAELPYLAKLALFPALRLPWTEDIPTGFLKTGSVAARALPLASLMPVACSGSSGVTGSSGLRLLGTSTLLEVAVPEFAVPDISKVSLTALGRFTTTIKGERWEDIQSVRSSGKGYASVQTTQTSRQKRAKQRKCKKEINLL